MALRQSAGRFELVEAGTKKKIGIKDDKRRIEQ
jgi:hypothetical protein